MQDVRPETLGQREFMNAKDKNRIFAQILKNGHVQ